MSSATSSRLPSTASGFAQQLRRVAPLNSKTVRRLVNRFAILIAFPILAGSLPTVADDRFPTAPGTYWVYRGKTSWTMPGTNVVESRELTWRVEVKERRQGDGFEVAVLSGFPSDLAWYEPGKQPGEYALIILNGSAYYLVEGAAAVSAVREGQGMPAVQDSDLLFRWPLHTGDRFGEPESVTRSDGMYCWVVEEARRSERSGIERYSLTLRTMPDHEAIDFVPGLGVVAFAYAHHGTVSSTDLRLIEFGRP